MLGAEELLGWVGGLPEYSGRVWELHPIVVRLEYRRRGVGRALVAAFEAEAAKRSSAVITRAAEAGRRAVMIAAAIRWRLARYEHAVEPRRPARALRDEGIGPHP